jgi:hypothetical protein
MTWFWSSRAENPLDRRWLSRAGFQKDRTRHLTGGVAEREREDDVVQGSLAGQKVATAYP